MMKKLINVKHPNNIIYKYYMKCYISDNSFKYLSILISLIIAFLFYKIIILKNTIILNYTIENKDLIDECYN